MTERSSSKYIMLTRPEPVAGIYKAELEERKFKVLSEPLLTLEDVFFEAPVRKRIQGIIFTSANAVGHFAARFAERDVMVYVTGPETFKVVQEHGFQMICRPLGTAQALVEAVIENANPDGGVFLHPRGRHIAYPVGEELSDAGFDVEDFLVYDSIKSTAISPENLFHLKNDDVDAIMFFSKRTAQAFAELVQGSGLAPCLESTKALCISAAVLECVHAYKWAGMHVAETPDRAGMNALLTKICG